MTHISRRKALKTIGVLAGTAAFSQAPAAVKAATTPLSDFDTSAYSAAPHTAVLLGAGKRGKRVATRIQITASYIRITALAEKMYLRRKTISRAQQLPFEQCAGDWRHLLNAPERLAQVAILCLPQGECATAARTALLAGYDVWIDRPLSLNQTEEADMVTLAKRQGRRLMYIYVQDGEFKMLPYRAFQPPKQQDWIG